MKPRALAALLLTLAFAAIVAWIWLGRDGSVSPVPATDRDAGAVTPVPGTSGTGSASAEKVPPGEQQTPQPTPLPPVRVASSVMPGAPLVRSTPTPQPPPGAEPMRPPTRKEPVVEGKAELEQVRTMLRDFRTRIGANPVGSNAEIMRAIMGGNDAGARLGPPEGQELNAAGELVDRWGTPYFFHQLSKTSMEIRSAGPDGKLWTTDDLISK